MTALLTATGLDLVTLDGRTLVRDLSLAVEREKVAIVGRNGVGKSSLLEVLAGTSVPDRGRVERAVAVGMVAQSIPPGSMSHGQARRAELERAFGERTALLLLDEPTEDLDEDGRAWLFERIDGYRGGMLVVTHDRELLGAFGHFFVMAESGCRYVSGTVEDLENALQAAESEADALYLRRLSRLVEAEQKNRRFTRRRSRKRAVGRLHELDRNQSKSRLNTRKAAAEVAHGRLQGIARERIGAVREWVGAARRAMAVSLPLELVVPSPEIGPQPAIDLVGVGIFRDRWLCRGLDLRILNERIALVGPNGSGKTSLLGVMGGERQAEEGRARIRPGVATIGQGAQGWATAQSLRERLWTGDPDEVAALLVSHRFPLALADRPMGSLSPGERTRAALICVFQQPGLSAIVLDEPTRSLDPIGLAALTRALVAWEGALVVASHDRAFLGSIGIEQVLELPMGL